MLLAESSVRHLILQNPECLHGKGSNHRIAPDSLGLTCQSCVPIDGISSLLILSHSLCLIVCISSFVSSSSHDYFVLNRKEES